MLKKFSGNKSFKYNGGQSDGKTQQRYLKVTGINNKYR